MTGADEEEGSGGRVEGSSPMATRRSAKRVGGGGGSSSLRASSESLLGFGNVDMDFLDPAPWRLMGGALSDFLWASIVGLALAGGGGSFTAFLRGTVTVGTEERGEFGDDDDDKDEDEEGRGDGALCSGSDLTRSS